MTRTARRSIFYILLAIFFIVGIGVVLYAEGWRFDFERWRPVKVGAIYIRSYPQSASIYLNGMPVRNQSGFLSPGTLISDLLPRVYDVTLKAAGYDTWQEDATVAPSLVTQYKYAVLVPQNGKPVASNTMRQLAITANAVSAANASTTDPFDATQKIIIGKNKVFLFNTVQATTTLSIAIPGRPVTTKWITPNLLGILQSNGELYLYDLSQGANPQALRKLADDATNFSALPDGSMVAVLEHRSLEVFSLNDASVYYRFNLPDIATATNTIWYKDRTHLFIIYPDHVSFLDLADMSLTNYTTVAQGANPQYDPQTNALYIAAPGGKELSYLFSQ